MLILLINMILNKLTSNNHQIIFLLLSHYGIYLMYREVLQTLQQLQQQL